jgi:hypothetical protein
MLLLSRHGLWWWCRRRARRLLMHILHGCPARRGLRNAADPFALVHCYWLHSRHFAHRCRTALGNRRLPHRPEIVWLPGVLLKKRLPRRKGGRLRRRRTSRDDLPLH